MRPSSSLLINISRTLRLTPRSTPIAFPLTRTYTTIPTITSDPLIPISLSRLRSRPSMSQTGIPSETAQIQKRAEMSTSTEVGSTGGSDLGIESQVNTASGVQLSERQRLLVGSVLDLFAGKPTKSKTALWTETATFADPLTIAEGRKQYEAQWWGLKAAFSSIEQLHHSVTSSGNPIEMDLSTNYTVKGLGTEKKIDSKIKIWTVNGSGQSSSVNEDLRISKVEDRWDGEIPEGAFAKAFRNLNSVTVPAFVSVPKDGEEKQSKA